MWSNAFLSQARWNWTTFGTAEKVWDRVRQYFVSESERIWTAFQRIGKHQIGRRGRPMFFLGNPSAPGEFRTATDRARKRFLLEALRVWGVQKKIGSSSESVRLYFSNCIEDCAATPNLQIRLPNHRAAPTMQHKLRSIRSAVP